MAPVAAFGGLRGGRPRKDGLIPGSPEARAADAEKERTRKARYRARLAAVDDPPPLPPPGAPPVGPVPPEGGDPAAGALPAGDPPIPWQAEDLKPLLDEVLPLVEAGRVRKLTEKAQKARFGPEIVREIAKDAEFPETAKKAVEKSLSRVAAKLANATGIGAQYKDETILAAGVVAIVAQQMKLEEKLDRLIAEQMAAIKSGAETKRDG